LSRATTVLGGCLGQLRSELIELLSSSLQDIRKNTCDCCADCHIKLRSKLCKCIQISFCTISGVLAKIISIFKSFEMLEIHFVACQRS